MNHPMANLQDKQVVSKPKSIRIARGVICCLLISLLGLQFGCNARRSNVAGTQAFQAGQLPIAINRFQQALNSNPQNADAYYNLAASYYELAKQTNSHPQAKQAAVQGNISQYITQAEQLYRQAISLNDQHADAHRGLAGLLIETDREPYAFDLLNEWQSRHPNSTEPLVELARVYQEYGDQRRAADFLSDALKLNPNDVRTLKAMGHVRELQGQSHLALDNYLRVLQLDGKQTGVAQRVASLQSQLQSEQGSTTGTAPQRYGAAAPYLQR